MADRLSLLAEEVRAYKIETDDTLARALDRIAALEAAANTEPGKTGAVDLPAIAVTKKTDTAS